MSKNYKVTVEHYETKKRVEFDPRRGFRTKDSAKRFINFIKKTTPKESLIYFKKPRIVEE